ncbi:MAG: 30S ribosomal protein S5 [Candidatus Woesearchaeota archaeon]|nr:MAG: 30S ribosomal protein S5 [Candidatus Woesearchaeota archaeon]
MKPEDKNKEIKREIKPVENVPNGEPDTTPKEEKKSDREIILENWLPKTSIGKQVKSEKIVHISQILESGIKIMEPEIIDKLFPELESEFINVGQLKGKFGGGKRRIFKQTQKKTREGNKPVFTVMAIVGNRNGYIGLGIGRSEETLPAKEKALRNAKLNLIQIARGCGSWECGCGSPHSIPFEVSGREGSVRLTLLPAPKGIGLSVENDLKNMLALAGIKDAWSKVRGQTKTKVNLARACFKALEKLSEMRVRKIDAKKVTYGEIK